MAVLSLNLIKHSGATPAIQFNGSFASLCFIRVQSQHSHLPRDFRALCASVGSQALWRWWFSSARSTWHLRTEPKLLVTGVLTMVLLGLTDQPTGLTSTPPRICGILSRGRWETPDPITQMSLRPLSKHSWASITPQQNHRLITFMPHPIDEKELFKIILGQVLRVHKITYLSEFWHFCIINPFYLSGCV